MLFTRIINIGGRAALAIDLVLYAIMSNWYYDLLPGINVPGTIETAFSKECTLPRHWTGRGVVIGVVVIYLMCALTIILRYATHVSYIRQGNMWYLISQLVSAPILESNNEARDENITKQLEENDIQVKIGRSKSGGVGIVSAKRRSERQVMLTIGRNLMGKSNNTTR